MEAIAAQREIESAQESATGPAHIGDPSRISRKSIDDFRSNPRYGGDATREDLAYAIYSLAHGADPAKCPRAQGSRSLPQGRRQAPGSICRSHDCKGTPSDGEQH